MNQPMTPTTPEQLAESVQAAIEIYDGIAVELGGDTLDMRETARESADHLRMLFPDLSEATLAGFMAFVFTNIALAYRMNPFSSSDLLAMALSFGQVLKQFTPIPDSPEQS